MNDLKLAGRADFGRFQFVASKVILEFYFLLDLLRHLPPQENKVNAAWIICIRNGSKIGILSKNKLG